MYRLAENFDRAAAALVKAGRTVGDLDKDAAVQYFLQAYVRSLCTRSPCVCVWPYVVRALGKGEEEEEERERERERRRRRERKLVVGISASGPVNEADDSFRARSITVYEDESRGVFSNDAFKSIIGWLVKNDR